LAGIVATGIIISPIDRPAAAIIILIIRVISFRADLPFRRYLFGCRFRAVNWPAASVLTRTSIEATEYGGQSLGIAGVLQASRHRYDGEHGWDLK
jgi:hypothetical protein